MKTKIYALAAACAFVGTLCTDLFLDKKQLIQYGQGYLADGMMNLSITVVRIPHEPKNGTEFSALSTLDMVEEEEDILAMELSPEFFAKDYDYPRRKRDRPFFKDAGVHVLHVGDQKFAMRMGAWLNRTHDWIQCMGYFHRFEEVEPKNKKKRDPEGCVYTKKVRKILHNLLDIPDNDWLIFLDMDVQYQAPTCDGLERFLLHTQQTYKEKCEFFALTSLLSINTGVLVLQATDFTRTVVQEWYDFQMARPLCTFAADQCALQEIVLKRLAKDYDTGCVSGMQNGRNRCFNRKLPVHERWQGHLCLMPCPYSKNTTTLQCHDCELWNGPGSCYESSAIFYHSKQLPNNKTPPV